MLRRLALATATVLLAGCSARTPAEISVVSVDSSLFLGADVSALTRIEAAGGVFRDGADARDALALLRARGSNGFRLRIFVSPNHDEVQVNDLAYTVALARRVKSAGARLLLDFHYSDTWADPGHQATPAAWRQLDFAGLEQEVTGYSASVIAALKAADALPDIVQIGNEVDGGMLWPLGRVSGSGSDTTSQWRQFAGLLQAGITGVRSVLGPGDSVRIMIHYSGGGSAAGTRWFFDHLDAYGVPYDIIGLSYYPWWQGTLPQLKENLSATALRFGRDIIVVETSYPWRAGGWESMATRRDAMTWPITAAGQAQYLRDLLTTVRATPGHHGRGVLWWYPEAIQVPDLYVWGGGSLSWFDSAGHVLPAPAVFAGR